MDGMRIISVSTSVCVEHKASGLTGYPSVRCQASFTSKRANTLKANVALTYIAATVLDLSIVADTDMTCVRSGIGRACKAIGASGDANDSHSWRPTSGSISPTSGIDGSQDSMIRF